MSEVPECLACGACCFSRLDTYVRVTGDDHARLQERADDLVSFHGNRAYMRMVDGHCAALVVDAVRRELICTVYETRPQTCRDLERGLGACMGEIATKADRPLLALAGNARVPGGEPPILAEPRMTDPDTSRIDTDALSRWLMDAPHEDDGGPLFMRALVECFERAGVPLFRLSYALMTMHPEVLWRTVQWRRGREIVVKDQTHARLDDAFYTKSPVALARRDPAPVRVPLGDGALPFSVCEDVRADGGTDYVAYGLPFSNGEVSYVSFATDEPSGFSAETLAAFESVRPFLARRIELESSYYATRALLDVYLGRNAARRVFAGEFQRGKGELIDAAIWFSDMRDFTALSDRTSPRDVIAVLDAYFDAVASAIASQGGEVLKFIGDAVLAIFPILGDEEKACRGAILAADEAFLALRRLNEERTTRGESAVAIGVALHRGQVMYGNIGARDRLDFTVISSAVNEASRLESLCKSIGTRLALSDAFVTAANLDDVVDLGAHALKGVKAPLHVFTLEKHRES